MSYLSLSDLLKLFGDSYTNCTSLSRDENESILISVSIGSQLYVSRSLWHQVEHEAVDSELSANQMVIRLLEEALEARHSPVRTGELNSESDASQKKI